MSPLNHHIILRITALLLVLTLLVPTTVKLFHSLADHEHEVCISESTHHVHEIDIDCEFYKFKISKHYLYTIYHDDPILDNKTTRLIKSQYGFLSDYQKLPFALRGPPAIV